GGLCRTCDGGRTRSSPGTRASSTTPSASSSPSASSWGPPPGRPGSKGPLQRRVPSAVGGPVSGCHLARVGPTHRCVYEAWLLGKHFSSLFHLTRSAHSVK